MTFTAGDECVSFMPDSVCSFICSVLNSRDLWVPSARFLFRSAEEVKQFFECRTDRIEIAHIDRNLTSLEEKKHTLRDLDSCLHEMAPEFSPKLYDGVVTCSYADWWSGFRRIRNDMLKLDSVIKLNRPDYWSENNADWHNRISALRSIGTAD